MQVLRLIVMRYVCSATVALAILVPALMAGPVLATGLVVTDATVGQNLETAGTVTLSGPVPAADLQITLTSNDPSRLLLSKTADSAGSASIVVNLQRAIREPEFYLQGLAKSGTATYTASAPGFSSGTAKVTLAPSGVVISGPYGIGKPSFLTTTGSAKAKISVHSVVLDSSLNYVVPQLVAAGQSMSVTIASSNPTVGTIATSAVKIPGGSSSAMTQFQPAAQGETTLAVTAVPSWISPSAQFTTVTAKVVMPGLAITEGTLIGQNLQAGGNLSLGEAAPAGGVVVTLTCDNPDRMLLSPTSTDKGSASLTIKVPAGAMHGSYFMQALGGSGPVTYTASAPGYRSRTATVTLTVSGMVLIGPLSFTKAGGSPGFVASLASGQPTTIYIYTAYLDPVTHRSADVTVQPLRPGVSLSVELKSSNPDVGTIASPVVIPPESNTGETRFTPLKPGMTVISVVTPPGYTASTNATALKTFVTK